LNIGSHQMEKLFRGSEVLTSEIEALMTKGDVATLKNSLDQLIKDDQKIIQTKQVLDAVTERYSKLNNDNVISLGEFLVEKLGNNSYFESQLAKTKENLADVYAARGDYYRAARTLAEVNFESPNMKYTKEEKIEKYVLISEYYFEAGDTTMAETYVRKCGPFVDDNVSRELRLRYEVAFARSMDNNRKFLQAAQKYQWLASQPGIEDKDLMALLNDAIVCVTLGPAGPQKARIIGTLIKDERSKRNPHYDLLNKMYLDKIVYRKDTLELEKTLKTHQNVVIWEKFTVLQKAVIEHNIIAVSKLYENISVISLAKVLELSDYQCEKLLQTMVGEKRLTAILDQVSGYIDFTEDYNAYTNWTNGINNFCTKLDKLVSKIQANQ